MTTYLDRFTAVEQNDDFSVYSYAGYRIEWNAKRGYGTVYDDNGHSIAEGDDLETLAWAAAWWMTLHGEAVQ